MSAPSGREYLEKHGMSDFLAKMTEALLSAAPEDPWAFMINYISNEKKGGKAPTEEEGKEVSEADAQAAAAAQSQFHDHLSLEERALVVDSFLAIDTNRDGSIDVSEMRTLLGDDGDKALQELNRGWEKAKSDGEDGSSISSYTPGKLHLFQWLAAMNHFAKDSQKFVEALKGLIAQAAEKKKADDSDKLFADADRNERWLLTELFLAIDSNRDGVLDTAECRLFEKLAKLPSSEADGEKKKKTEFSLMDTNNDKRIQFQEFLNKGLKDLHALPDRSGARQAAVARLHSVLTTLKTGKPAAPQSASAAAKKQPAAANGSTAVPDDSQLGRWMNKMKDVVFSNEREDHFMNYASSPIPAAMVKGNMPSLQQDQCFAANLFNDESQEQVSMFESDKKKFPPSIETLVRFDDASEQAVFKKVFGPDAKVMIATFASTAFVIFENTLPKNIDECPETTLYGSFGMRINKNIDTVVPVLLAIAANSTVTNDAPWWPKQQPKVKMSGVNSALAVAADVELNDVTVTDNGLTMRLPKLITDEALPKPENKLFVHSTASPHEEYEKFKKDLASDDVNSLECIIDHRIAEHQQAVAKFLGRDLGDGKVFVGRGPGLVVCVVVDLPPANSTGAAAGTVNGALGFADPDLDDDANVATYVTLALLKTIEIKA